MLFAAFSTRQTTCVFCTLVLICFVCLHHSVHSSSTPAAVTSSDNSDNPLQLPPTVLDAIRKGTIKESSALGLLKDVAALRESLSGGAAAERVLLSSGHGTPQQQQQQQQQQQREPSRGILIVAGGSNQFRNAYILLKLLAHPDIRCTLPVEVVYYGPQEYDAPTAATIVYHLADGTGISVKFIDGQAVAPSGTTGLEPHKAPGRITGFKAKVHALVWVTSFDQVIMLDSDNTPLTDPKPLLDSEALRAHGSIFWPDFWTNQWMKPAIYSLLGLDTPWEVEPSFRACEAGQVVLDRVRHRDVLEYLWLLNTHSNSGIPGAELGVVGQCLWGDKDTYPIAFSLAGKASDFYRVPHMPLQALARPGGEKSTRLTHAGMVHRAPWGAGPLMWLHRTAAGKFWPHCMSHGSKPCRIWALSTAVDQTQLLATVRDPSAMELDVGQLDLQWAQTHCRTTSDNSDTSSSASGSDSEGRDVAEGGGGAELGQCSAGEDGQQQCGQERAVKYSNATALPCDLDKAAGVLPIPVIRTSKLPAQVKRLLQAAQKAFELSKKISAHYQG